VSCLNNHRGPLKSEAPNTWLTRQELPPNTPMSMPKHHIRAPKQAIEGPGAEERAQQSRLTRLANACAKLDPAEERSMAEEGLGFDVASWPGY
jgi:hypothetical protein